MEFEIFVSIELTRRMNFFEIREINLKVAPDFSSLWALFSIRIVIRICINIRINHFESSRVHFFFILFHPCMQISDRSLETSLSHEEILRDQTLLHTRYEFRTRISHEKVLGEMHIRLYSCFSLFRIYMHSKRRRNNMENNSCV